MLDKFAEELKSEREKSGLSLQQVATKTRIDLKFLEAIEQGNFSFLPDLYVKAFIKDYAKAINLDEGLILKKYDAAKQGSEYDPNKPETENEEKQADEKNDSTEKPKQAQPLKTYFENPLEKKESGNKPNNKQNILLLAGGAVVIVVFVIFYVFVFSNNDKIVVEETPIEEVVKQTSQRYEEEPAQKDLTDSTNTVATGDSLYLTFYAKETSWVNVILDNNKVQEFTLYPNSKFTISAQSNFQGTIGNSGGVSMQVNNKPVEFLGRSGLVKHFKLDKNGLVYLNTPPKLEN